MPQLTPVSPRSSQMPPYMKKVKRLSRSYLPEYLTTPQRRLLVKPLHSGFRAWDHQVSSILFRSLGQKIPRQVLLALEYCGSGLLIPLFFLVWILPLHLFEPHFRAFCLNLFLGFFTDLALVGLLKGTVRRQRPVYNEEKDFVLVVRVDRFSFPSGHASRAVFIALLYTIWRLGRWWLRLLIWWTALATAMSRILMGRHYFTDVVAGVLVGIVNGILMTKVSCCNDRYASLYQPCQSFGLHNCILLVNCSLPFLEDCEPRQMVAIR